MDSHIFPDFTILSVDECISLYQQYSNKPILENTNVIEELKNIWKNKSYHNLECTICLEELKNGDNLITECGHYYHSSCVFKYIASLIKNNKLYKDNNIIKCPKCKKYLIDEKDINEEESNVEDSNEYNNSYNTSISSESLESSSSNDSGFGLFYDEDENGNTIEYTIEAIDFSRGIDITTGNWTGNAI